jgi:hypothetical protein
MCGEEGIATGQAKSLPGSERAGGKPYLEGCCERRCALTELPTRSASNGGSGAVDAMVLPGMPPVSSGANLLMLMEACVYRYKRLLPSAYQAGSRVFIKVYSGANGSRETRAGLMRMGTYGRKARGLLWGRIHVGPQDMPSSDVQMNNHRQFDFGRATGRLASPAGEGRLSNLAWEGMMKLVKSIQAASAVLACSLMVAMNSPASAEKREMTYVKTNYRTFAKSSTMINDGTNHEVRLEVTVSDIVYSDPKFGKAEEVVYLNADEVDGSGRHTGYFIDTHADGSQCYGDFEGSTKTTANADGSWSATWEGTYRFLGGSGICKGLRGSGKYKGGASSTQPAREEGREVREF